jgi:NADH:ubiquinone oxidoreductase subunit
MDPPRATPYISRMTTIGTRIFTWLKGRLVGRDGEGNAYYEEKRPRPGQAARRWVIFAGAPEASKVPPEWHTWLHYTTDTALPEGRRPWQKSHLPNLTGTAVSYRPVGHDYQGGQRARATGDYEAWTPGA